MTKRGVFWLLVATLAVGWGEARLPGLILAALPWAGVYLVSLRRHWLVPHRGCGGRGSHAGRLFSWARRACLGCGGSGTLPRWGVRRGLGGAARQRMAEAKMTAIDSARRTWRG